MLGSHIGRLFAFIGFSVIANGLIILPSNASEFLWYPLKVKMEIVSQAGSEGNIPLCSPPSYVASGNTLVPPVHLVGTLNFNSFEVVSRWSPDDRYLVTSGKNIDIWSFPQLKKLRTIEKVSSLGNPNFVFVSDRGLLTTTIDQYDGVSPNAFSLIDVKSGNVIRKISGFSNPPRYPLANSTQGFGISFDTKYLFSWFNGDTLKTFVYITDAWKIGLVAPIGVSLMTSGPGPDDMAFLDPLFPDNQPSEITNMSTFLILNGQSGSIRYKIHLVDSSTFEARTMAIDWKDCVVGLGAGSVRYKNLDTKINPTPYIQTQDPADALKLWYPGVREIVDIPGKTPIESISFSSTEHLLAYIDGNSQAKLVWLSGSSDEESEITTVASFDLEATDVQFSEDGKYLAVSGDDSVMIYKLGR